MENYLEEFTYLKFRYILSDGEIPRTKMYLASYFIADMCDEYYASCGYEVLNKTREPTNPHLHMHFVVKNKTIGSIRKALQREFKRLGETRKGNSLYSLAEEEDVKDLNRFLRYAWKQGGRRGIEDGFPERLPPDMDINLQEALAIEEQDRMWDFNCKKKADSLKPNTKDKLFEYLDEINEKCKFITKKEILIKIMEYYNQEEKSANKSTILGYLQTAVWRYGLETFEETADSWLRSV